MNCYPCEAINTSIADPHHLDVDLVPDLDPACHFDADPDPTFHVDADLDPDLDPACNFVADLDPGPTFHFDADPDPNPSFQINAQTH
jgi:hypothetical protein